MIQKNSVPDEKALSEFLRQPKKIARNFRDLVVYQKAFAVSLDVHQLSLTFPKHELFALGDQLRRSTKSICANIAEGFDKQQSSKAEFKRFLTIAIGSCNEVSVWLDYVDALKYIEKEKIDEWKKSYHEILKMLSRLKVAS